MLEADEFIRTLLHGGLSAPGQDVLTVTKKAQRRDARKIDGSDGCQG